MRLVAYAAALIGLAALGAALGDFASDPNVLGALGLCVLVVVLLLALGQLFRPGGIGSRTPAPRPPRDPEPPPPPPQRDSDAPSPPQESTSGRQSVKKSTPAPVWSGGDGGWDAREADEARARRREHRSRRKRR